MYFKFYLNSIIRLSIFIAFSITYLGNIQASSEETKPLRVSFTVGLEGNNFDTTKTNYITHREIGSQLHWPLILITKSGKKLPASAHRWVLENDGKNIRFFLRKDLRWSNGTPVTAHDFYRNYQRLSNEKSTTQKAFIGIIGWEKWSEGNVDAKIGLTVVNDHELLFEFKNKNALRFSSFADTISCAIALEDYLEIKDQPWIKSSKKLSYGPYMITDHSDTRITVEKNPYFPDKHKVDIERIIYTGTNFQDGLERYSNNQIDILTGPIGKQKAWVSSTYKNETISVGTPRVYFLLPDSRKAILQNNTFLNKLYAALDRKTFSTALFGSSDNVLDSNIPRNTGKYPGLDDPKIKIPFPERLAKVKEFMLKNGYSKENPLKLKLGVAPVPGYDAIAGFIKGSWETIFIKVELIESDNFYAMIDSFTKGHYDLAIGSFIDQYANPHQYLTILDEYSKLTKLKPDPHYSHLLQETSNMEGEKEYITSLKNLDQYILDKKLLLPIVTDSPTAMIKPKFSNIEEATTYVIPNLNIGFLKYKSANN
jgi:oligopeptide transport system substrate-binding protein